MPPAAYDDSVFLNCPFDPAYRPLFEAVVFVTLDRGFSPRCALEVDDSSQVRLDKIADMIRGCRYAVHDVSRTKPDPGSGLPRFNMPLELGLFLGAKRSGRGAQREKACIVLDRDRYRYQQIISDIAGQDIRAYGGDPVRAIGELRDFLRSHRPDVQIPGWHAIATRYAEFRAQIPEACARARLRPHELTFTDLVVVMAAWLDANPWR